MMEKGWTYRLILGLVIVGGALFIKGYEELLKARFSLGGMDISETMIFVGAVLYFALLMGAIVLTVKSLWHKLDM